MNPSTLAAEKRSTNDSRLQVARDFSRAYLRIMSSRRTIRSFSSEPVDEELLLNAIRTAGTAPSGANRQPWLFALIRSEKIKREIKERAERVEFEFYTQKAPQEWLDALRPLGTGPTKPFLTEAPALIAVFSRTQTSVAPEVFKRTYYPIESTGIATGLLISSLQGAGLATLTHTPQPMTFLNEILQLDSTFKPFLLLVVGYPSLPIELPAIERKELAEILLHY